MSHFLSPGLTNRYSSCKWIHFKDDKGLVAEDINSVFSLVRNDHTNLISVFGRARQGKSFLMNCLAGEKEIFKVSNEKESCTQGIDISNKWLPLRNFSTMDGGTEVYGQTKIGFVDAEGQGDRDVTYDANLVCPILLASKCVIFNWKGDLQKDHILSTLGIMTRAAKNVADETDISSNSGRTQKKFGHLHICFRDWQATGTNEKAVYQALFSDEPTSDATVRNQIRRDIMQNFTSVNVWLFEAPCDSTKQLKEKLTYQMTSSSFKMKLRFLRNVLSQQLRDPTIVANRELSGQTMGMFVKQIVYALNNGESVLPSSAYKAMMTQEAQRVVSVLQSSIAEKLQFMMQELEVLSTNPNNTSRIYPSELEAKQAAERAFDEVISKYGAKIHNVFGDGKSKLSQDISKDLPEMLQKLKSVSIQQFMNAHQASLANYTSIVGQIAEERIYAELRKLESDDCECMDADGLNQYLNSVFNNIVNSIGGVDRFQSSIWSNRLESLRMVFMNGKERVQTYHSSRYSLKQEEALKTLSFAQNSLLQCLQTTLQDLTNTRSQGFSRRNVEDRMNAKYRELKAAIQDVIPEQNCMYNYIVGEMRNLCVQMQGDLQREYDSIRMEAFQEVTRNLMHDLEVEAESFATPEFFEVALNRWENECFNPLDSRNRNKISENLDDWIQQIYNILVKNNKDILRDWDDLDYLFDSIVEVPNQKFVYDEFGRAKTQFLMRLKHWKLEKIEEQRLLQDEEEKTRLDREAFERQQLEQQRELLQIQRYESGMSPTRPASMRRLSGVTPQQRLEATCSSIEARTPVVSATNISLDPTERRLSSGFRSVQQSPCISSTLHDEVAEMRDTLYEARQSLISSDNGWNERANVSSPYVPHVLQQASHSNRNTPNKLNRDVTPNYSRVLNSNSSSKSFTTSTKKEDILGSQIHELSNYNNSNAKLSSSNKNEYVSNAMDCSDNLGDYRESNSASSDDLLQAAISTKQYIESERQKAVEYALKHGWIIPDDESSVSKKTSQTKRRSTVSSSTHSYLDVRSSGYGQSPNPSKAIMPIKSSIRRFDKENSRNFN